MRREGASRRGTPETVFVSRGEEHAARVPVLRAGDATCIARAGTVLFIVKRYYCMVFGTRIWWGGSSCRCSRENSSVWGLWGRGVLGSGWICRENSGMPVGAPCLTIPRSNANAYIESKRCLPNTGRVRPVKNANDVLARQPRQTRHCIALRQSRVISFEWQKSSSNGCCSSTLEENSRLYRNPSKQNTLRKKSA